MWRPRRLRAIRAMRAPRGSAARECRCPGRRTSESQGQGPEFAPPPATLGENPPGTLATYFIVPSHIKFGGSYSFTLSNRGTLIPEPEWATDAYGRVITNQPTAYQSGTTITVAVDIASAPRQMGHCWRWWAKGAEEERGMTTRGRVLLVGAAIVLVAAACYWLFVGLMPGGASRLEAMALTPEEMAGFVLRGSGETDWDCGTIWHPSSVPAFYQEWEDPASGAVFRVTWATFGSAEAARAAGVSGGLWTQAILVPGTYSGQALGDASWHFAEAVGTSGGWVSFVKGRFAGSVNASPGVPPVFLGDVAEDVARRLLENMEGG